MANPTISVRQFLGHAPNAAPGLISGPATGTFGRPSRPRSCEVVTVVLVALFAVIGTAAVAKRAFGRRGTG